MYSPSDKAQRVEFRGPDPSCNGYPTFSAMLMAALDGIKRKMDPGKPMDVDVYELSKEELASWP
jgi:glutamine synthetase